MKPFIASILLALLSSPALGEQIQVHFICDTKDAAKEMVRNVFVGHRMLVPGCRNIEDLQYSIVEQVGELEPVQWQNRVAYVGYVRNDFIRGYSAGQLEYLVN